MLTTEQNQQIKDVIYDEFIGIADEASFSRHNAYKRTCDRIDKMTEPTHEKVSTTTGGESGHRRGTRS